MRHGDLIRGILLWGSLRYSAVPLLRSLSSTFLRAIRCTILRYPSVDTRHDDMTLGMILLSVTLFLLEILIHPEE